MDLEFEAGILGVLQSLCRVTWLLSMLELILVSNPIFLGKGNHLGPFSGASDRSEDQEQIGGAEGG